MEHFLVVGGTKGIGKVLTEHLSKEGNRVSVLARNAPVWPQCAEVSFFATDITDATACSDACHEVVAKRGKIDHLVCMQRYRGEAVTLQKELDVSVVATRDLVEFFSGNCTSTAHNTITIANSIAASLVVDNQPLSYHIAKAALDQLIRYYAVHLGAQGIRVNGVSPGTVLKPESAHFFTGNEALTHKYRIMTPLGRMGTAQEVVDVIAFLASRRASFITGQTLVVDGGMSIQGTETVALRLSDLR